MSTQALTLWRITRAEFADSALSGAGGLYVSGRWHQQGLPVVYLASAWSLAALEVLVHVGRRDLIIPYVYIRVDVPMDVPTETIDGLPADWDAQPPGLASQRVGSDWLRAQTSLLLQVPSVISPVEHNWVLNPRHPDAAKLIIADAIPFRFDARLRETL